MREGLEDVVAASTRLSHVDGEAGRLTIAGYAVEDLAPYAPFEEVAYLLLHGRLPEPLERFIAIRAGRYNLDRNELDELFISAGSKIHHTHSAATEFSQHSIPANHLAS